MILQRGVAVRAVEAAGMAVAQAPGWAVRVGGMAQGAGIGAAAAQVVRVPAVDGRRQVQSSRFAGATHCRIRVA
ncbi:MAG: hypothetical protein IPH48_15725 [bacterium]|nr:hypothetical protein [bacterium]